MDQNNKLLNLWWWENKNEGRSNLESIRSAIEGVDRKLIEHIVERTRLAPKVARCKFKSQRSVYSPLQEIRVLKRWRQLAEKEGFPRRSLDKLLAITKLLMQISKDSQRAYLDSLNSKK